MRLTTWVTNDVRTEVPRAGTTSSRLGERLRQLRVSAGLTQTDLAGDRCSKEYVSQIERGKTRPTRETIEWLASRLGVDPSFLSNGVSADERGRMETALARAEALSEAREYEASIAEFEQARAAVIGIGSAELEVRALVGEAWARMENGDVRAAVELLDARTRDGRGARLLGRRPRRRALPPRRLPLPALERVHRRRPPRRGARRWPSAPDSPATRSARTSSAGAHGATGASATGKLPARTSSARSSSPRASTTGTRSPTSSSRRRSSQSGTATGCSPAPTPSAPRASTSSSPTRPTSASSSTTSADSTSCSAGPSRRSSSSRSRSACSWKPARRPTRPR